MITTISFDQLIKNLQTCNNWLGSLNIDTKGTRFRTLYDNVQAINEEYLEKRAITSLDPKTVYYSLTESIAFTTIYEAFKSRPDHLPKRKVKESLGGPFFAKEEIPGDANVNPRNYLFELELAARFILHGFNVTSFEDIEFKFECFRVCVQCKRPQSDKSVESNINGAYNQLKSFIFEKDTKGLIAISVEKVLGIDDIDDKFLPTNDENQIGSVIDNHINNFRGRYEWAWKQILNIDVLAILTIMRFISMLEPKRLPTHTYIINVIPLFCGGIVNSVNDRLLKVIYEKFRSGLKELG